MSTINGYDSNSISALFSSVGTTNNNSSSSLDGLFGVNVTDYASIRNGSYGKLMKAYYDIDDSAAKKTDSKNDTDDTDHTLMNIKSATADLKKSAQALYSSKTLFEKNKDGEYDMEAIYDKVSKFIDDYNSAVGSVGAAETSSLAKAGASLVNAVSENADMFDKMGITINSDCSLSINKTKFMESKISDVKSMFNGVGSFAYQIGSKASRIYNMVEDKVDGSVSSKSASSSSTSKDTASTIAKIQEKANDLNSIGIDLYKNTSLFKTSYTGTYDTDAIEEKVGKFIEVYNEMVISAEKSESSGISNAMKTLNNIVKEYEDDLKELGITIDEDDNTLVLDKAKFAKADMYDAKKLFSGTGSFAYQVSVQAAMVASQAETEASKANTYTDNATYANNYNTGTIYSGTI